MSCDELGTRPSLHGLETGIIIHNRWSVKQFQVPARSPHPQNFVAVPCLSPGPVERHLALLYILRHFATSHAAICPVNKSRKIRYNVEDRVSYIFAPTGASVPWARGSDSCKCVLIGSRMHGRYSETLVTYCFSVLVIASVSLFQPSYYRLPLCFPF